MIEVIGFVRIEGPEGVPEELQEKIRPILVKNNCYAIEMDDDVRFEISGNKIIDYEFIKEEIVPLIKEAKIPVQITSGEFVEGESVFIFDNTEE